MYIGNDIATRYSINIIKYGGTRSIAEFSITAQSRAALKAVFYIGLILRKTIG
jgi:hypothetical protein